MKVVHSETLLRPRDQEHAIPYPLDTMVCGPPVLLTVDVYLVILPRPLRPIHVATQLQRLDTATVLVTGFGHELDRAGLGVPAIRSVLGIEALQHADVLRNLWLAHTMYDGVPIHPAPDGRL